MGKVCQKTHEIQGHSCEVNNYFMFAICLFIPILHRLHVIIMIQS